MLRQDKGVQIFEIVSSRPNANLLRQPGNEEAVAAELERIVLQKVDQLADNVRQFIDGRYAAFGTAAVDGDVVCPFVVQYKSFLRTDAFHEEIQRRFFGRLGEVNIVVREVELLDAEVLEGLEEYLTAEVTLGRLVEEKTSILATRSELFKNFLARKHPEMELRFSSAIRAANDRWREEIAAVLPHWRNA